MVVVPANMSRLSFGPCKFFFDFGPCKIFCFFKSPSRDYFQKQIFLQGPV